MNDIRQGICPLCGHNQIIEAQPKTKHVDPLFFADAGKGHSVDLVGHLWAYACRRCDYTQLFTEGAAKVPTGPEHGTRLISGPAAEPFR